jgi:DNA polymerase-1
MRSLIWANWPQYALTFLVPQFRQLEIEKEYLHQFGIPTDDVRCLPLHFTGKKTSVAEMKKYVTEALVPELQDTKYLVVADAGYFGVLTGQGAEKSLGYVRDCLYGPWKVVYVPNVRTIFYDPVKVRAKIAQGLGALLAHIGGTYQEPGNDIIHLAAYPTEYQDIQNWLLELLAMDCDLTIDIEAFDLKHHKAGIGTISFAWSKHEGIAFPVDYKPIEGATEAPFGIREFNGPVRQLLKAFFRAYLKKAIYHNISYDVYNLIFQLFMTDVLDTEGLLEGLDVMLRNWDDTQLITYLATNTCAGNELGLKPNSQEFAGNYMVDVEDITTVPLDKLLRYNLIDSLATWFVYEKYHLKMVADQQLEIYETLFKPSILDIIQMQLTGLPVNMERVKEVKALLEIDQKKALDAIHQNPVIQQFTYRLKEQWVTKRNLELKKKRVTIADADKIVFNPNSGPQLQDLLYNMLGLPVLDLTDNKNPATGADTLKKLVNHTTNQDVKSLLGALQDIGDVDIMLTTFIPAFLDAVQGPDRWHYLIGSFRLGGTLSGRLSSRNPNLQNIPANSRYAKLIKTCFQAPPGWVFCGLDFSSLEDRISALTTKDPNKLKVYTDGYDGHSLRAFAYFGHLMPDIVNTVASINSIQGKYKKLRQDGKAPTFALTYQGTWSTLAKNCGFSEKVAKEIEAKYHTLYTVSDEWVLEKLNQAARDGFVTAAFGLRIRTPLLAQVLRGNSSTPREAEAEGRSAGNALGQSWCLLTNRASVEFMTKVRKSEHRLDIRPCAHIHDAQYFLVRDDMATLLFTNEHLVKAVQWQEHPDIQHDDVHLGGVFSIFWPDWSLDIEVPNGADEAALMAALNARLERHNGIGHRDKP